MNRDYDKYLDPNPKVKKENNENENNNFEEITYESINY